MPRNAKTNQPSSEPRKSRIPVFATIQEEADFWDTHEVTEFWDELKPVKVRFAKNLSDGITVRFDPDAMVKLRTSAAKKGIGPTTLVRMWVMERLGEEKTKQPKTQAPAKQARAIPRRRRAG